MKLLSLIIGFGCLALLEAATLSLKEDNISLICNSEGRFEDKDDCGSFVECTLTRTGRMMAKKRSCHGKAFDVETRTCQDPSKVRGCNLREGRQFYSSMRFNMLCADGNIKYACGDCGTQITCADGKAYETKCEGQLRCTEESNFFDGAVCHTNFGDKCKCTEANSYRQDPFHKEAFFMCKDVDSIPSFYNCPPGMHFDEETKNCLNEDGTPGCTEAGVFPYPDDCSKYYMCTYTVERWLQTKLECGTGLLFNEQTKVCENPCDWAGKDFVCEEQGRFRNPSDCSQFYECISSGDSFLRMTRICPPRLNWSDEHKACVPLSLSECSVKPEGPIKQCLNDYNAICEDDTMSQGSEMESENTSETETESESQPADSGAGDESASAAETETESESQPADSGAGDESESAAETEIESESQPADSGAGDEPENASETGTESESQQADSGAGDESASAAETETESESQPADSGAGDEPENASETETESESQPADSGAGDESESASETETESESQPADAGAGDEPESASETETESESQPADSGAGDEPDSASETETESESQPADSGAGDEPENASETETESESNPVGSEIENENLVESEALFSVPLKRQASRNRAFK